MSKKTSPSMDSWLKEAKAHESAPKIGMYLTHNGIVRESAKAKVRQGAADTRPVVGMQFSYNQEAVDAIIAETYKLDGIFYIKVWLNEGELSVGDDIMYVLIGGDIRPLPALPQEQLYDPADDGRASGLRRHDLRRGYFAVRDELRGGAGRRELAGHRDRRAGAAPARPLQGQYSEGDLPERRAGDAAVRRDGAELTAVSHRIRLHGCHVLKYMVK